MRDIARSRKFDKEYQKLGGLSAELVDVVYHLTYQNANGTISGAYGAKNQ